MVPLLIWFCRLLTLVLVANNWLPVTASLLAADSVPAEIPVSVRVPPVPVKFTDVPSVALATVIG